MDNAIEVQTRPLCKVLGVLQESVAVDAGGPSAPRIDPGGPYHEGKDLLNLTITPSRDGYSLCRLHRCRQRRPKEALRSPSDAELPLRDPNNYVKAGKRVVIGSLPKEREIYVFNPPLGANMVLVILSPQPTVSRRPQPQEEDGDDAGALSGGSGRGLTKPSRSASVPESCRWRHRV